MPKVAVDLDDVGCDATALRCNVTNPTARNIAKLGPHARNQHVADYRERMREERERDLDELLDDFATHDLDVLINRVKLVTEQRDEQLAKVLALQIEFEVYKMRRGSSCECAVTSR